MSRRKRRSPERNRPAPADPAPRQPQQPRPPHPPRPNKWFLLATAGLLVAWMAFLAAMALAG